MLWKPSNQELETSDDDLEEIFDNNDCLLSVSFTEFIKCKSSIPFLNATIHSFSSSRVSAQKLNVGLRPLREESSCARTMKQCSKGDCGCCPSIPSITKHSIPAFSIDTSPSGSESY